MKLLEMQMVSLEDVDVSLCRVITHLDPSLNCTLLSLLNRSQKPWRVREDISRLGAIHYLYDSTDATTPKLFSL